MKLSEAITFARSCSKQDLSELIRVINSRQREDRQEAKAQFRVGDPVTSNDPRWYHGTGYIEKINPKMIVVNCNGYKISVSPNLLIKVNL